jgi:oligopeptidase A
MASQRRSIEGWLANLSATQLTAQSSPTPTTATCASASIAAHVEPRGRYRPACRPARQLALVTEMLALRHEQARLLGFEAHAHMRLSRRMAETPQDVESFLLDLAGRSRDQARAQLTELEEFAAELGAELPLAPWDLAYFSEKLREHKLGINEEKLRPWFELQRVFGGLFTVAEDLFGLRFTATTGVETWHPDVRYYQVSDASGEIVAGLFLDLYARPRKSGGAWMDVCRSRMVIADRTQQPVAYLTCNFAPPGKDQPSLLTHDDVVTLFHEFGHCLHHLLTQVDLPGVGGISGVEWDAVELPSQLLEGWAWDQAALERYARHIDSGEPCREHGWMP